MPQVRIYATDSGKEPYTKAKIRQRVARITSGNFGDCKNLGGELEELRIDHGPGYRLYLSRQGGVKVLHLLAAISVSSKRI